MASAHLNQVHVCSICGAAIVQRFDDQVDRVAQHADWHRRLEITFDLLTPP